MDVWDSYIYPLWAWPPSKTHPPESPPKLNEGHSITAFLGSRRTGFTRSRSVTAPHRPFQGTRDESRKPQKHQQP